ncbi:hypothetical protein LJB90_02215 [Eubacteriales bacterium OttesenSCG-928-G02]|nr:hypothetical protein [Eubacteriales bacterium OttesenSCG-928-G02]
MKKIILFLIAFIIITALCACTDIPTETSAEQSSSSLPSLVTSSNQEDSQLAVSEPSSETQSADKTDSSEPEEQSAEESSEDSQPEEESSEISVEPSPLPYTNIASYVRNDIKTDKLDDYFKNSVFVGDSVFVHFKNFKDNIGGRASGYLGGAKFLVSSAFSAFHNYVSLENEKATHPKLNGERRRVEDSLLEMGAETVYLSVMPLNGLGQFSKSHADNLFKYNCRLIDDIKAKSPGITVVVISGTYLTKDRNIYSSLNNKNISLLNNKMLEYCTQNGIDFIDVATILMDGEHLRKEYSSDNYCHLKQDCYAKWTAILRNYSYAKQNGFYKNPESMPLYS